MKAVLASLAVIIAFIVIFYGVTKLMGAGALKRHLTMSGIYAVCRPAGYDVVCFNDADSVHSSPACVPLALAGGKCL